MSFSSLASQRVELGQLIEIRSSLVSPLQAENGRRPHVGPEHISPGSGCIDWQTVRSCADDGVTSGKYEFQPGDIIYSKIRPYLNKVAIADRIGLCSADMYAIKALPGCDARYLYRYLQTQEFLAYAASFSGRANIPKLNRQQLLGGQVPLPPLGEQRRIAAILDKADALRRKRKRALELLDGLTQSIVCKAFDDVHTMASLDELFEVQGGLQLSGARKNLPIEVPYLRVANVYRSRLDLSEIKRLRVKNSELKRTSLKKGDILFVEGHGNPGEVGRCAVWDASIDDCTHQNHLIRARPLSDKTDSFVLCYWLNGTDGRRHMLKRGKTTSGLNTISAGDVRSTPVPVLQVDDAKRVRGQLEDISVIRRHFQQSSHAMDAQLASLQHRAFSGQL